MPNDDFDYSRFASAPDDTKLTGIKTLADLQLSLEAQVTKLEEELKQRKQQLTQVSQVDLPEAMSQAGIADFTLSNGAKITVKSDWICHISKENQVAAFTWLRDNNLDSIIKRDIKAQFGKGDGEKAQLLLTMIGQHLPGTKVDDKHHVHPQTLKATLKELLEKGVDMPKEVFGLMPLKIATIKLPT